MKARLFLLLIITVTMFGCIGLPDDARKKAEAIPEQIGAVRKTIVAKQNEFNSFKRKADFQFFALYAQKEKWGNYFSHASALVDFAEKVNKDKVEPLLSSNNPEVVKALLSHLERIEKTLRASRRAASFPKDRINFLDTVRKGVPGIISDTEASLRGVEVLVVSLEKFVKKAKSDYPLKANDIQNRLAAIVQLQTALTVTAKEVSAEVDLLKKNGDADYAKIGDGWKFVLHSFSQIKNSNKQFRAKTEELYKSYSKTLFDMRADFFVQVCRTSWEESEWIEFPDEHEYCYPSRQVDQETFEYFDNLPEGQGSSNVEYKNNSLEVNIDSSQWEKLSIDPKKSWPASDNEAEYWVNENVIKYYHMYMITEAAKQTLTEWNPVDEDTFEDHLDNLGMDIVAKPFGLYEEEGLAHAMPPGIAYVGNTTYGQWKEDKNGERFWEWYGQYQFWSTVFGADNRYSYTEWRDWDNNYRGRKPYYGPSLSHNRKNEKDKEETYAYGSHGHRVTSSPWYRTKTYARSNGSFSFTDSSVRGAGSSRRGGGPGGGGK